MKDTYSSATVDPKPFTLADLKKAAEMIKALPPEQEFFYSKYLKPDDCYKIDHSKFGPHVHLHRLYNFVENNKLCYIVGKNVAEQLVKEGIFVNGFKDNG